LLDQIELDLRNSTTGATRTIFIDIQDNSLARKWLTALNDLLDNNYLLEKNYCFLGWAESPRNGEFILSAVNCSIAAINAADLGYQIQDSFSMTDVMNDQRRVNRQRFNQLHRYFEDLQGVSGAMSPYYTAATDQTRWHIRQLNLLCHEFEAWAISWHKQITAPEWQRPSQLMCWLNAPRFALDAEDYDLFGIDTINRGQGGVYVGVNKAVGKHHWEVFCDEGRDSRIEELVTTTLKSQSEAAGDFDIEWANNTANHAWQQRQLQEFREWLTANGFDPEDKALTIGHPQVGQVDLELSFGSTDYQRVWNIVSSHMDVAAIRTSDSSAIYDYHWSDADSAAQQIQRLTQGN